MIRFLLPLLLHIAALLPAQVPTAAELRKTIDEIAAISGFTLKRPIPVESMTRDQWQRHLESEIRKRVKPDEIRGEELVLKQFGLVPRDFDLRQATIDLLTEQAAAFYDHRRKKMVFVEGAPAGMMEPALAHELAHALADQHFKLGRFMDEEPAEGEEDIARLAVAEGQAMWLMFEYTARKMGTSLQTSSALLNQLSSAAQAGAAGFPVLEKAPLYIRETLLFPYSHGLLFQHAVVERMGREAFAEVLRRPPTTSQQVLHPEKYFAGATARRVELLPAPAGRRYRALAAGVFGQLDVRILLEQYISAELARRLAPEWRGGAYELLEPRGGGAAVLRWSVAWSSPEYAREFFAAYRQVITARSPDARFENGDPLKGAERGAGFRIVLTADSVQALEGL